MKKVIVIISVLLAFNGNCFTQTADKKPSAVIELWVNYIEQLEPTGTTKISYDFILNTGKDNVENPTGLTFSKTISSVDKGVTITYEGKNKVFSNEADLLKFLFSIGWVIIINDELTIGAKLYKRYIFVKYPEAKL